MAVQKKGVLLCSALIAALVLAAFVFFSARSTSTRRLTPRPWQDRHHDVRDVNNNRTGQENIWHKTNIDCLDCLQSQTQPRKTDENDRHSVQIDIAADSSSGQPKWTASGATGRTFSGDEMRSFPEEKRRFRRLEPAQLSDGSVKTPKCEKSIDSSIHRFIHR